MVIEKITNLRGKLLEGPVWDENREVLYFVDIECRKIYAIKSESKKIEWLEMPDYVSCLVINKTGILVAALSDGLYRVNFENKKYEKIMQSNLKKGMRFNDGKCDKNGCLWIGSMQIKQDENAEYAGELFCIEEEKIKCQYPHYTIPNGLAWNDEKAFFYHIDTPTKKIDRYEIRKDGMLENRKTAIDLINQEGSPDGMCMDADGNLWIAMWGGSKVICVN